MIVAVDGVAVLLAFHDYFNRRIISSIASEVVIALARPINHEDYGKKQQQQ